MEELFDSDVETDDESEKDDDDDDVDDVDDVDEEDENAEMIHERAHVVKQTRRWWRVLTGGEPETSSSRRSIPHFARTKQPYRHHLTRSSLAGVVSSGPSERRRGCGCGTGEGDVCRWLTSTLTSSSECCPCRMRTRSGSTSTTMRWTNFLSAISLDFKFEEDTQVQGRTTRERRRISWRRRGGRGGRGLRRGRPKSRAGRAKSLATLPPAARRKTSSVRQNTSTAQSRSGHSTAASISFVRTRSARQAAEREASREETALLLWENPADIRMSNLGRTRFRSTIGAPTHRASPRRLHGAGRGATQDDTRPRPASSSDLRANCVEPDSEAQLVARRTRGLIEQLVQDTKHR